MMPDAETRWTPLGRVPLDALREARLQMHHLVQVIPAFGSALVEPEEDDGHRSMVWDPDLYGFRSRTASAGQDLHVVVRPLPLEIQIRARGHVLRYVLPGHSLEEAFQWASRELGALLGGGPVALERPEYGIPPHRVGSGALFDASPAALEELGAWYKNATHLLMELKESLPEATTPLRAWPHHFDLAFRILLPSDPGPEEQSIGVGLSLGDDAHADPYLYVAPWPPPDAVPEIPLPLGRWQSEGWTGALLPAAELLEREERSQPQAIRTFLRAAMDVSRSVLAR
jgi:hypothetical protein